MINHHPTRRPLVNGIVTKSQIAIQESGCKNEQQADFEVKLENRIIDLVRSRAKVSCIQIKLLTLRSLETSISKS